MVRHQAVFLSNIAIGAIQEAHSEVLMPQSHEWAEVKELLPTSCCRQVGSRVKVHQFWEQMMYIFSLAFLH